MSTRGGIRALARLIACPDCDLLHREREVAPGRKAKCSRCGATLYRPRTDSINRTSALVAAGLLLYWPANFLPIMRISSLGETHASTMFAGARELYAGGAWWVGTLVLAASMLVPLVKLVGMAYVLFPLWLGVLPPAAGFSYRMLLALDSWGMLDVYMLGILVSIIKISAMATVTAGIGLWAFVALMLITVLISATLDPREVCERLEVAR